ncbi:hypothetical protein Cs7R123_48250 [Catellatospora sp. TT07R-123]|uniref:hypothetical protein n=1 Tax=Catellatospora sp. TT07R-123 TaxID=2733863 RepID=UPI001B200154|nr:hypothetical protein [Catellatospora sp. TT07R-123]GHJ47483.1 hypothetical protein Cs7R123_48250 [Catellatospora sp. TT07R-123]
MKADRRKVLSLGASAVIAAVAAPLVTSPAFAASPTIVDLGLLPGTTGSIAADINEAGVVVGNSSTPNGPGQYSRAFRWENGVMQDLGSLGGQKSFASGINNKGWIVGGSTLAGEGVYHAFLWKPGQGMVDIGPLGTHSIADDINDSGVVTGYYHDAELGNRGFRWKNGVMTVVENGAVPPDPEWRRFLPEQINNNGVIIGDNQDQAARWVNGTVANVGLLGSSSGGGNAAGDVTVSLDVAPYGAYVWMADGTTRTLQTPVGADRATPAGINDIGKAVGIASTGNIAVDRAVYWSETGVVHHLPSLVTGGEAGALRLNNRSQVVGWAKAADGTYRAVLWQPAA